MKNPVRFVVRLAFILGGVWISFRALMDGDMDRANGLIWWTVSFTAYVAWVTSEEDKEP